MQQVVGAYAEIQEMPRRNSRRIRDVIGSSFSRDPQSGCPTFDVVQVALVNGASRVANCLPHKNPIAAC
jgi:hypothetical protein